eukprot:6872250-Lingulodinium_polyedra.AAC.1
MAGAVAPGLRGRCLDTLMQVEYGASDPAIKTIFTVVDAWQFIICSGPTLRARASRRWPREVARRTAMGRHRWKG